MKKSLQEITLGEFIGLHESVFHLTLVEPKNEEEKTNLIANRFLQQWLFFNKNVKFEEMSEDDIKNAIIEYAEFELKFNDEISKVEYIPNEDILFQDDLWNICVPLTNNTLEGYERVEEIALILSDLQDNRAIALAELCCVYLVRLRGGDDEKKLGMELAKQLPLSIVFKVKKYIEDTVNIYSACVQKVNF